MYPNMNICGVKHTLCLSTSAVQDMATKCVVDSSGVHNKATWKCGGGGGGGGGGGKRRQLRTTWLHAKGNIQSPTSEGGAGVSNGFTLLVSRVNA